MHVKSRPALARLSRPGALQRTRQAVVWVSVLLLLAGCATITSYDPTSYKLATDLKAESLSLMEKADGPPGPHRDEIEALRIKLRKAYEYEAGKGRPNALTVKQWKILRDPEGGLIGGFLAKWERENTGQSKVFLDAAMKNVAEAFDEIITLENHKVKN